MQTITPLHISIEIAMIVLFLIVLADAVRQYHRNSRKFYLLILAFAYSIIFENINIYLSAGQTGGYHYSDQFTLFIWNTPLFIALAWSALIYTAMHISDMLSLKQLTRPFMDALIVVLIDLTLDVVAVRQGLWTWIAYGPDEGWFGIPADNYIGWMLVVFTFSFLFRYFTRTDDDMINKTTRTEYFFLLPAFAYLSMLVIFSLVNLAEHALGLTRYQELFSFWFMVIFFAVCLRRPNVRSHPIFYSDRFTIFAVLFTRLLFYSYIIWSTVLMELHLKSKTIILILLLTLVCELLIYSSAFQEKEPLGPTDELKHY